MSVILSACCNWRHEAAVGFLLHVSCCIRASLCSGMKTKCQHILQRQQPQQLPLMLQQVLLQAALHACCRKRPYVSLSLSLRGSIQSWIGFPIACRIAAQQYYFILCTTVSKHRCCSGCMLQCNSCTQHRFPFHNLAPCAGWKITPCDLCYSHCSSALTSSSTLPVVSRSSRSRWASSALSSG